MTEDEVQLPKQRTKKKISIKFDGGISKKGCCVSSVKHVKKSSVLSRQCRSIEFIEFVLPLHVFTKFKY